MKPPPLPRDRVRPALTRDDPWPGLAPFTEDQREYFFGREAEAAELLRRVRAHVLTILFGQSGQGKTSLVAAGLCPRLRAEDMVPIIVRLRPGESSHRLSDQVRAAIAATIRDGVIDAPDPFATPGRSLWEYLHQRGFEVWTPRNRPGTIVLIFDQFEEVFTLGSQDGASRSRVSEFLTELADVVENRPPKSVRDRESLPATGEGEELPFDFDPAPCRVLLSLREDFLADLEGLRRIAPSVGDNRYRLQPMTGTQALEVLRRGGGDLIDEQTAELVVRFVGGKAGTAAGREAARDEAESLSLLTVEPALLSIFASELNRKRRAMGLGCITPSLLEGNRDKIIGDFYERAVEDAPAKVRQFIENRLLTPGGFRDSLSMEVALGPEGMDKSTLERLVGRRLLHVDQRFGSQRIELTHDVLTGPARASRDERARRQGAMEAEARERLIRAQLARARRRLVITSVVAVLMLALAAFSLVSWTHAQRARKDARLREAEALASRDELDAWVSRSLIRSDWGRANEFIEAVRTNRAGIVPSLVRLQERAEADGALEDAVKAGVWLAHADPASASAWLDTHSGPVVDVLLRQPVDPGVHRFFEAAQEPVLREIRARASAPAGLGDSERVVAARFGMQVGTPVWGLDEAWCEAHVPWLCDAMLDLLDDARGPGDFEAIASFFPRATETIESELISRLEAGEDPRILGDPTPLHTLADINLGPSSAEGPTSNVTLDLATVKARETSGSDYMPRLARLIEDRNNYSSDQNHPLSKLLDRGQGALSDRFAYCQSLPAPDAAMAIAELGRRGFQLRQFRPFRESETGEPLVAALWERSDQVSEVSDSISPEDIAATIHQRKASGFAPIDITFYYRGPPAGDSPEGRIAVVWRRTSLQDGPWETRAVFGVPETDWTTTFSTVVGRGFNLVSSQAVLTPEGRLEFYGIVSNDPKYSSSGSTWSVNVADAPWQPAAGDLRVFLDIRPHVVPPSMSVDAWWTRALADARAGMAEPGDRAADLERAVEAMVHLGRYSEAISLIDWGLKGPESARANLLYWRCIAHIRTRAMDLARGDRSELSLCKTDTGDYLLYLDALIAIGSGGDVTRELEEAVSSDRARPGLLYNAACVYAWGAGSPAQPSERREQLAQKALELLDRAVNAGLNTPTHALVDTDMRAIHSRPEFVAIAARMPAPLAQTYLPVPRAVPIEGLETVCHGPRGGGVRCGSSEDLGTGQRLVGLAAGDSGAGGFVASIWAPVETADPAAAVTQNIASYRSGLLTKIGYNTLSGSALKWWDAFEKENTHRSSLVLKLAEEIAGRGCTINDFFLAYVYSNTDNIQGNLHFLDFVRSKKQFNDALKREGLRADRLRSFEEWCRSGGGATSGLRDVSGWTDQRLRDEAEAMRPRLMPGETPADVSAWWNRLDSELAARPLVRYRLMEQLLSRTSTRSPVGDLARAAAYSDTDDLLAQVQYMTYLVFRADEASKRDAPDPCLGREDPTGLLGILDQYARARLSGERPPAPPRRAIETPGDLSRTVDDWCGALSGFPAEVSLDLVYFVSGACSDAYIEASTKGITGSVIEDSRRLSKAAKYLVHEKDIAYMIAARLAAQEDPSPASAAPTAAMIKQVRDLYGAEALETNPWERPPPGRSSNDAAAAADTLCPDLDWALSCGDLTKASELWASLRPTKNTVRSLLKASADPGVVASIEAVLRAGPTPGELHRAHRVSRGMRPGGITRERDPSAIEATPPELTSRLGRLTLPATAKHLLANDLRPGVRVFEVEFEPLGAVAWLYWDGSRWSMLGPVPTPGAP